ncbi:MAG TPA: toprim domain-containing protein, partial [Bacteroidia bacterium]|nr:toprim domain-containing protein [Bacteroidia bacterium]
SLNEWSAFTDLALKNGYKEEFLEKTGLMIINDAGKKYDRFRGRVMFPIHNLSGRVIGFGGRVLKKDEKSAKYVNSPESEIYHKSQSLYGIYFAKKAIVQRDTCYLVEGYTDVISLHQSGIENVVASSGTSLTVEHIRLIGRYTKNITVLYDGDAAGIKASIRGIDLILEEGLNVKVVLFPDGDDPDSYSRKHSHSELLDFVNTHARDFVMFKTSLLLDEVKNDPVRKAGLIRDVVETIARIPDPIIRSMYLKQSSAMMDIDENLLITELNKIRRQALKKEMPANDIEELLPEILVTHKQQAEDLSTEIQERNIIRLLFNFGNHELHFYEDVENPDRPGHMETKDIVVKVSRYIVDEIAHDDLVFENKLYDLILQSYTRLVTEQNEIDPQVFLNSEDPQVSELTVELLSPRYFLSENWEVMHKIIVPVEEVVLKDAVEKAVFHLKNKKVLKMIDDNQKKIKAAHETGSDYTELMEMEKKLQNVKMEISKVLGIDILK